MGMRACLLISVRERPTGIVKLNAALTYRVSQNKASLCIFQGYGIMVSFSTLSKIHFLSQYNFPNSDI